MIDLPDVTALIDEPMKNHTTFGIGGPVSVMYFPETIFSMQRLCGKLRELDINPYVIGNGSNLLVSDNKHDLVVINTTKLRSIKLTEAVSEAQKTQGLQGICADSGVLLSELAVFAHKHGLKGLEFAHGIPGTLGGAVVMNAGAYEGEIKDVIFSTRAYNRSSGEYTLIENEHEFSYRTSVFSGKTDIVLSSVLHLEAGDKEAIGQKMEQLAKRRRESQPLDKKSAGSTFKRPKEGFAAALIEQAGLKGFSIGGAQVSSKHAGFVVNNGNAAFDDVIAVMEHVCDTVLKHSGVLLEPEIKVLR